MSYWLKKLKRVELQLPSKGSRWMHINRGKALVNKRSRSIRKNMKNL